MEDRAFTSLLVLRGIPSESPDGEAVAIRGVGDAAGAVKDTCDSLLVPVAAGLLTSHEELDATIDDRAVLVLGLHECQQGPSGLDNTAMFGAQVLLQNHQLVK